MIHVHGDNFKTEWRIKMEDTLKKNEDLMNKPILEEMAIPDPTYSFDSAVEAIEEVPVKKDLKKKAAKKNNDDLKKFEVHDCAKLNIRVAPDISSEVAKTVNNGDFIKVDTSFENSDFYKVIISNKEYYAMKRFLK